MIAVTGVEGARKPKSRSEEEATRAHRRRPARHRSAAIPLNPRNGGGAAPLSLSLLLNDVRRRRPVVASRNRRRRACHKCHCPVKGPRDYAGKGIPSAEICSSKVLTSLVRTNLFAQSSLQTNCTKQQCPLTRFWSDCCPPPALRPAAFLTAFSHHRLAA